MAIQSVGRGNAPYGLGRLSRPVPTQETRTPKLRVDTVEISDEALKAAKGIQPRKDGNESAAIGSLRTVSTAQSMNTEQDKPSGPQIGRAATPETANPKLPRP